MKKLFLILMVLSVVACGKGKDGKDGVNAPVPPVVEVDEDQQDIDNLIQDENDYRLSLGQTMLSKGLSCTLYTFTSGQRIQATSGGYQTLTGLSQVATFLSEGVFNQPESSINDGMNVLPMALRNVYKNMYMIRCQGQIVVSDSDYYSFELTSDDASVLYINGTKVIDNDNNHGPTKVTGQKYLRRGVHTIRLDYAQAGGGSQALILTSGEAPVPTNRFYH